jgi:predicted nucleic acid-binding protein
MTPKKATSKATTSLDDATKVVLAEKKGKEALVDDVPHEALEDGAVNSKRPHMSHGEPAYP